MDSQTLLNIGLAAGMALIGWLARELWSAVKDLRDDLNKLQASLPLQYVTKDDFRQAIQEIKQLTEKILDKLDNKADK